VLFPSSIPVHHFAFISVKKNLVCILFYCHYLENYASLKSHNMSCVCIICYWAYNVPHKIDKSIVQKGRQGDLAWSMRAEDVCGQVVNWLITSHVAEFGFS